MYSSGVRRSHGYDIYDIKNCTTVSRTRQDIRKYKHTKIEREILERANRHLAEMREEFLKNDRFQNSRFESPVEFEISDYDKAVKNCPYPQTVDQEATPTTTPEQHPATQPETTPQNPQVKQEPLEETPRPRKGQRELRNLDSGLDGKAWECSGTHERRRLRVRTTGVQEEDEYQDNWDNTVPAQDANTPEGRLNEKDS